MYISTPASGTYEIGLPAWGRSFWQDPNTGTLFLAYASGNNQVNYVTSADSGVSWASPKFLFPVDDFRTHNNFDIFMDYFGHVHCGFRHNDSGCYQFFGRNGNEWTADSGRGIVTLNTAGDGGLAKGWMGSIHKIEASYTSSSYGSRSFPLVIVASRDSDDKLNIHTGDWPHNELLTLDYTSAIVYPPEQCYPVIFTNNVPGQPGGVTVATWRNLTSSTFRDSSGWSNVNNNAISPSLGKPVDNYSNFAIGSGSMYGNDSIVMLTSPSGHILWTKGRTNSIVYSFQQTVPSTPAWRLNVNTPRDMFGTASGVNCDFTHNDNSREQLYYLQGYNELGAQCIKRFKGVYNSGTTSPYEFTSINHIESGVKIVAEVGKNNSGGRFSTGYWEKFKAVKHPVSAGIRPNPSHYKGEFLVTSSWAPSSPTGMMLNIFDVEKSIEVQPDIFKLPKFYKDFSPSATITASGSIVGHAPNLIDGNTITYASVPAAGAFLELNLGSVVQIDKIELMKGFNQNWGTVAISGSLDGTEWTEVSTNTNVNISASIEQLVYVSASGHDYNAFRYFRTPICKYLRFHWSGNNTTDIYDIRIFGGRTTRQLSTTNNDFELFTYNDNTYRPAGSTSTERCVYHQDTLPPSFETYGDVTWGVKASGEFSRVSSLPSEILSNGLIPNGTYAGQSYGHGDGFSLQNDTTTTAGHSGVLQTSVYIDYPRTLSFYYKRDLHAADSLQFFTNSVGDPGSGVLRLSVVNSADWTQYSLPLSAGTHQLKWVYNRGATTTAGRVGAAWIDDIVGLHVNQPTINSYLFGYNSYDTGVIHSYMNAIDYRNLTCHAFMSGAPLTSYINAFLPSSTFIDFASSIDAYMKGNGVKINGYMLGSDGPLLSSIPTGTIHAVMGVGADHSSSSILSFLAGTHATFIHGYLRAADQASSISQSGDFSINSYLLANKPFDSIHAILNAPSGTSSQFIHGYAKGDIGDQIINAYLLSPEGGVGSIDAYAQGWDGSPSYFNNGPQSMVYAYMSGPISSGTATIHTYMLAKLPNDYINAYMGPSVLGGGAVAGGPGGFGASTSGVTTGQNWIDSYLKGYDGGQQIHAYIMGPDGGFGSIDGYLLGGKNDNRIWGYLPVWDNASGIINAYASGIGFGSQTSYGYLFGASGLITSAINSFLTGHNEVDAIVYGVIQGRPEDTSGCLFFGLVPENPGTIPTNSSPGMFI